tara:strand:+ start:92 stop:409 length:318 start_codon:yes stop_codon:yes gene_type:complete
MQKNRALKLKELSEQVALNFSRTDREFNHSNETFKVSEIVPLSESTAIIKFEKSSGKIGLAFCYWINMSGGQWKYFFPTYDHCAGFDMLKEELHKTEIYNFKFNE